ncbi:uracil-DNA glycosylase [Microcella humidisoli]|uniref:Uracil-DNA glycosylase n=1 Tax=Microcella humidisoli TaxID=2963406 RepID=A0ABY5FWM3_9MICO|nr:uracil-DNA glycosylase [Microcella humidisoli]UTT62693.1 uracil-DNA glycosylase [Microcella humidisoli]
MSEARAGMAPDWAAALEPVTDRIDALLAELRAESATGSPFLPAEHLVLRAFARPLGDVRVVIVGQDPYPTPGHPIGLSFAVDAAVRPVPRSLANVYRELHDDLGIAPAAHGDLSAWSDQGVLLLNRVLTVAPGRAGSHRGRGWEEVTACALQALGARGGPLVAVLWGRDAADAAPLLGAVPVVASAHPSPLSAHRGFVGSRPFSRVNRLLAEQGAAPIDWRLPPAATVD